VTGVCSVYFSEADRDVTLTVTSVRLTVTLALGRGSRVGVQTSMFSTISAILHLGNLEVDEDQEGNAALVNDKHFQVQTVTVSEGANYSRYSLPPLARITAITMSVLTGIVCPPPGPPPQRDTRLLAGSTWQAVCALLHLDEDALRKGLCTRLIVAGGEKMVKQETPAKALQCRDALAKTLYSRLFDNVVKCVNSALRVKNNGGGSTMQVTTCGITGITFEAC
jgi:hypothetical protein